MSSPEQEQARILLAKAGADLSAARTLAAVDDIDDAIIGFHVQQAIEKSLKAVLAALGIDYPYTHDLTGLIDRCTREGVDVPDKVSETRGYTSWATDARYEEPALTLDRADSLAAAGAVIEWATGEVEAHEDGGESER